MVDQYIADIEIDRYGENVTVSTITSKSYSKWGDLANSATTSQTIKVVHNDIQGDEAFNLDGRYQPGDKIFFAKNDASVNVGDIITFESNTYEIKDVIIHHYQGKNFCKEVRTSKI